MKLALFPTAMIAALLLAACGDSPRESQSTAENSAPSAQSTETPGSPMAEPAPAEPAATTQTAQEQLREVDEELETSGDNVSASVTALPIRMAAAATPATSARFTEGKNYKVLVPAQPTDAGPDKVEVVEVFWYGCGHCYALDPSIESWRSNDKPGYVDFRRLPAMWNDTLRMHARMFYTADALGKLDELHTPLFRAIHIDGNMLNTPDKIRDFFAKHGVAPADFDKTFSSFAVETKLQRADLLNRRYRVTSVPMIVVNGKYTTDVGSAGGPDQLFDLVDELAAHEENAG